MSRYAIAAVLALLLATALLGAGCKHTGDDDDSGDDAGDDDEGLCGQGIIEMKFIPDGPQGAASVWMDSLKYTHGDDHFDITVKARGMANVYGMGARMTADFYSVPPGFLDSTVAAIPGNALGEPADLLSAATVNDSHFVFGFTRKGDPTQSADFSNETVLGTLRFTLNNEINGTEIWTFDENASRVFDNDLNVIPVDGWGGARVSITTYDDYGC